MHFVQMCFILTRYCIKLNKCNIKSSITFLTKYVKLFLKNIIEWVQLYRTLDVE